MYCGNNLLKNNIKGNPYSCMKKGIGIGLNTNCFDLYIPDKKPIKVDCSINANSSNADCLRKGIGIGKKLALLKFIDELISDIEEIKNK